MVPVPVSEGVKEESGIWAQKTKRGRSYNRDGAGSRESRLREKAPELGTGYVENRVLH